MIKDGKEFHFWFVPFVVFCLFMWGTYNLFSLNNNDSLVPRNNIRYSKTLLGIRGGICDRNGAMLVLSQPAYRVFVDPKSVNPKHVREAIARKISDFTGCEYRDAYRDLCGGNSKTNSRYLVQGETFDEDVMMLVTNRAIYSGVGIEQVMRRIYPHGSGMAHVIGYVNHPDPQSEEQGQGGIELKYERYLRGTKGILNGVRARDGSEIRMRRDTSIQPLDGATIHLTLDQNIQNYAEQILAAAVRERKADSGRIIIERVATGEILAMASYPAFDPANYRATDARAFQNRTISGIYDPGSTMKPIIVAAAMQEGIVTPETTIDLGPSRVWYYGGWPLHDHYSGNLTVRQIIAKSSNIGAAKIGLELGNRRMEAYLRAFGFGAKTGIDLPGEENGILRPHETWEKVTPTRIAIGHGVSVTPMQLANAYSTIANNGVMMRPHVVSKVVAANGEVLYQNDPLPMGRPISERTARTMRDVMVDVVEGGTAKRARVNGYSSAGKTGTAQMLVSTPENPKLHYSRRDYWASFCGFVPAEDPEFVVLVVIDRPFGYVNEGGAVAAPVFSKVAEYTAQYLGIRQTEETIASK